MKRLRRTVKDLLGTNDAQIVGCLRAQTDAAIEGAEVAAKLVAGGLDVATASTTIGRVEHEGDRARGRLVEGLRTALTTPFDREDLFRLSRSIDDVLDNLRDFVREFELHEAPDGFRFVPVLEEIVTSVLRLGEAIDALIDQPETLTRGALAAKKAGNGVRQAYQHAIAELFAGDEVTMHVLRCRELLRRLDVVGLRLGEAADALADGAMKRSH